MVLALISVFCWPKAGTQKQMAPGSPGSFAELDT